PNLIVNGELVRRGFEGFHFFGITPFGLAMLGLAVGYMLVVRRWLVPRGEERSAPPARPRLSDWIEQHGLADREYRLRAAPGSPLAGKRLEQLDLRGSAGVNIIAIERGGRLGSQFLWPTAKTELQSGDILLL